MTSDAAEKARLHDIWKSVCERGKANGNMRVSWQKLAPVVALGNGEALGKDVQIQRVHRIHRGRLEEYEGSYRAVTVPLKISSSRKSCRGERLGV